MSDFHNTIKHDKKSMSHDGKPRAGDEHGFSQKTRGLSTCHIPRKHSRKFERSATITVYSDGSLITVSKNRGNPFEGAKRDWVRGKIKKFSYRSRSRMMKTMATINKNELPQFITLTYPNEFPTDSEVFKADLEKLCKRLQYRFPQFSAIWKQEFQTRGAVHFHLLAWGLPKAYMKPLLSKLWFEVVGSGDEKHLRAGTNIQNIRSWRGVCWYVSKYMAKVLPQNPGFVGRYWGIFNRSAIPWSAVEKYKIFQGQAVLAMRYFRRYAGLKSRDYSSLSIFVNDPDQWKRALLC